jgi:hypothetical protein
MSPLTLTSCTYDQRQQYPGLPMTQARLEGVYMAKGGFSISRREGV